MFKGACRLDDPTHRSINFLHFQVKNFLPEWVSILLKKERQSDRRADLRVSSSSSEIPTAKGPLEFRISGGLAVVGVLVGSESGMR